MRVLIIGAGVLGSNLAHSIRKGNEVMMNKIKMILLELGNDLSFIGNQYKITMGNEAYFIDMLFYHTKLHCYDEEYNMR